MEYNIGDVVQLKSGGPEMTVENILGKTTSNDVTFLYKTAGHAEGALICKWFVDSETKTGLFKPELVEKAPDIGQLLRKVEEIAKQEYGGHYSILKFTTHFKGGFYTPNLDGDGRQEVSKLPSFLTLPELLVAMIKNPKQHELY